MQVLKKNPEFVIRGIILFPQVILSFIQQLFEKDSPGASLWAGLWEHNRKCQQGSHPPSSDIQWELQKATATFMSGQPHSQTMCPERQDPGVIENSFPPPQLYLSIRPRAIMPTGPKTTFNITFFHLNLDLDASLQGRPTS